MYSYRFRAVLLARPLSHQHVLSRGPELRWQQQDHCIWPQALFSKFVAPLGWVYVLCVLSFVYGWRLRRMGPSLEIKWTHRVNGVAIRLTSSIWSTHPMCRQLICLRRWTVNGMLQRQEETRKKRVYK